MISLTRLSGSVFLLNADLVERVDETPDTVVTLVDGTKYVVTESLPEIRDRVVSYRAEIVARSSVYEADARAADRGHHRPASAPVRLAAVRGTGPDQAEPGPSQPQGDES